MGKIIHIANGEIAEQMLDQRVGSASDGTIFPECRIQEDLLQVFASAAEEVLAISYGAIASRRESYWIAHNPRMMGEVTGWMRLGGSVRGVAAISLNWDLARTLAACLACMSPDELEEIDILDGIGELVNQISGRARTLLSEQGSDLTIDLPELRTEVGQGMPPPTPDTCYAVVFECLGHRFALQFCVEVKQAQLRPV